MGNLRPKKRKWHGIRKNPQKVSWFESIGSLSKGLPNPIGRQLWSKFIIDIGSIRKGKTSFQCSNGSI